MTQSNQKVPANFVPAAAVKRRGQVLFGMTGRKEFVGGHTSLKDQPIELLWEIFNKRMS